MTNDEGEGIVNRQIVNRGRKAGGDGANDEGSMVTENAESFLPPVGVLR